MLGALATIAGCHHSGILGETAERRPEVRAGVGSKRRSSGGTAQEVRPVLSLIVELTSARPRNMLQGLKEAASSHNATIIVNDHPKTRFPEHSPRRQHVFCCGAPCVSHPNCQSRLLEAAAAVPIPIPTDGMGTERHSARFPSLRVRRRPFTKVRYRVIDNTIINTRSAHDCLAPPAYRTKSCRIAPPTPSIPPLSWVSSIARIRHAPEPALVTLMHKTRAPQIARHSFVDATAYRG